MNPHIRRIRADEGPLLRALRLRALAEAPMAYGSTLAREQDYADDLWRQGLSPLRPAVILRRSSPSAGGYGWAWRPASLGRTIGRAQARFSLACSLTALHAGSAWASHWSKPWHRGHKRAVPRA